jgi:hypothetical protein
MAIARRRFGTAADRLLVNLVLKRLTTEGVPGRLESVPLGLKARATFDVSP